MITLTSHELDTAQKQDRFNDDLSDLANSAHVRRMRSRKNFIESNPNAVSPQERAMILGRAQQIEDRNALQNHELDMLKTRNQGELDIQRERTAAAGAAAREKGLADQTIAGINADVERERIQAGLTQHERELANKEKLAGMDISGRKEIAEIQGKSALEVEQERGKSALAQADLQRQKQERDIAAKIQAENIKSGAKMNSAQIAAYSKSYAAIIGNAMMSDEQKTTAIAELDKQYGRTPAQPTQTEGQPQKGMKKTFPNGEQAEFDGTKWVKIG